MTDTDRTSAALMTSLALHALVVVIVLLFTYSAAFRSKEAPRIFELVQGDGNNYMATEAPKLGTPGGVKITVPAPVVPKAEPVVAPEPAPIKAENPPVPPPTPTKAATKAPPAPPSPAKRILTQIYNAEARAKKAAAKQREEDAKRAAAQAKVQHIDGAGIAKGVVDGSAANDKGGANGKALTSTEGDAMERYESALMAALRRALEEDKPSGLGESLATQVEFHIAADGTLSSVRITKGSGSREFDDAVRAAFRKVGSIGPKPDRKAEDLELTFKAKDDGE